MVYDDGRLALSGDVTDLEALPARVDAIERKLDALAVSVNGRFDDVNQRLDALAMLVDRRFSAVDEQFVEQRQYTEFAFARLEQMMTSGFDRLARLDRRMDQLVDRLAPSARSSPRRPKKR